MTVSDGPLFTDPDPDRARAFFREKKTALDEKVMSVAEAVGRFVHDGDYVASGGFGTNRIATSVLHEILRQGPRDLGFAGHTTTHDFQVIAVGDREGNRLVSRVDAAYIVGLEARGLSRRSRQLMESGDVDVCEWTNYAMACRLRAAAAGVPFHPIRSMLGTQTADRSAARKMDCPFTGKPLLAVPALYPDVAFIHVHEADPLGNCRIRGITVADAELARASKRVIVTAERLITTDAIREAPYLTTIPSLCVDAVCEVPFGSYPGNMPGEYFSDEEHLSAWLSVEEDEAAYRSFVDAHIFDVPDFSAYLELCGGADRLAHLRSIETGS